MPETRDGVVRGTERAYRRERPVDRSPVDAVDPRHLERLCRRERRQDRRQLCGRASSCRCPAGRMNSRLCPPAAAIVERLQAVGVTADVGEVEQRVDILRRLGDRPAATACRRAPPPQWHRTTSRSVAAPTARCRRRAPPPQPVSGATTSRLRPPARAPSATASVPRPARTSPPSDSSPCTATSASCSGCSWPLGGEDAAGDREVEPGAALLRYAGARLTVTRRCGNSKPELVRPPGRARAPRARRGRRARRS